MDHWIFVLIAEMFVFLPGSPFSTKDPKGSFKSDCWFPGHLLDQNLSLYLKIFIYYLITWKWKGKQKTMKQRGCDMQQRSQTGDIAVTWHAQRPLGYQCATTKILLVQLLNLVGRPTLGRVLRFPDFFNVTIIETIVLVESHKALEMVQFATGENDNHTHTRMDVGSL